MAIFEERRAAFQARGGTRAATCDYCRYVLKRDTPNKATEYHHIFPKSSTVGNDAAREASNSRYLCACLCDDCHRGSNNVHNATDADRLLVHNVELFGYDAMAEALSAFYEAKGAPAPQGTTGYLDEIMYLHGDLDEKCRDHHPTHMATLPTAIQ